METTGGVRSHIEADAHRALAAEGLACAEVTDALGRAHRHRAHVTGLVSPVPTRRLFGRVVTISFFPTCAERLGPEEWDLTPCVGHAESRKVGGGSEMIHHDGKEKLP